MKAGYPGVQSERWIAHLTVFQALLLSFSWNLRSIKQLDFPDGAWLIGKGMVYDEIQKQMLGLRAKNRKWYIYIFTGHYGEINTFSTIIQVWWKFCFIVSALTVKISRQIAPNTMTAQQSCQVQKLPGISWFKIVWERMVIWITDLVYYSKSLEKWTPVAILLTSINFNLSSMDK